ncbi:MAG: phage tail protein [Mobiluncus sp.]|uniref:phage tail spike protein n=1 Tax=Mobiluncus sp. TaxID=47293 RepID=UPI0025890CC5|nr:phage tail spike protein [Mobiluncus sp.]MCI6583585.1 phage tail protein [Mobiluncus sp.]
MITLHGSDAQRCDATGLGVLDPQIISPVVTEKLNASFMLEFDYPAWGEYADKLTIGAIVACPVPWSSQKQAFRITAIDTSIDQVLHVEAVHVFFDLAHNLIADTFVVNKTPSQALTQLLGAANYPHGFTAISSDTGTIASARVVRTSIAAAILDTDEDNSFVNRWGGEFTFDNWQIKHAPRRGSLTGVVIQDRKNLTGYTSTIDTASLVTRILPVGYDGLLLPELYVDSPRINDYAYPFVKVVTFDQVKAITDPDKPKEDELPLEQAYAKLRDLAKAEYTTGVDLPTASYDVSFVDLSTTREYADLAELEHVNLGDTVTVKHTDLGVNLTARVVSYTYDPLTKTYLSIELGSTAPAFTSVTKTLKGMSDAVAQASEAAAVALASADGKNSNYYGEFQPQNPHLGDTWFKDEGEAGTSIWYWGITDTGEPGWIPLIAPINEAVFTAALQQAQADVEQAKQDAAAAVAAGQQAATAINAMQAELADTAADVSAAQSNVTTLKSNLAGVDSKLTAAKKDITTAATTAASAKTRADAAALLAGMLEPGNLVWNPRFRENGLGWGVPAGGKKTIHTSGGFKDAYCSYQWSQLTGDYRSNIYNGYNDAKRMIPTTKGRTYKISIRIRCAQTLAAGALKILMFQGTSSLSPEIPAGTWFEWETTSTITSDASYQGFTWLTLTGVAVPLNTDIDVCEPYVVEAATEWLIIDGAIKTNKIAAGAVDASKIKSGSITSAQIAAGTITSGNIAANAINAGHIQTGAITASEIATGAVTTIKLAAGAITSEKIAAETITAANVKAASITSDKLVIANGFITTAMIADAAITNAKISALDAGKINTGTLNAARIAAGSITSDKLTIANGFIKTAMIADAAITSAKISALDAAKITTGYLNAARIQAGTITADKFASNAIQVGLAGWTNAIRITPYQISWYSGTTLQGRITSDRMEFYYGDRYIGSMGQTYKEGNTNVRGISMWLNGQGDFVTWGYRTGTTGTYTSFFTLDPKGSYYGAKGIHLGTDLRTHGWTFYTNGNRGIDPQDATLTGKGTFPAWASTNNYSKIVFGTSDLYLVTKNTFYNMTSVMARIKDLMGRVNTLINLLNHGWITSISGSGSNISWQYYSNTGYSTMSTTLT